MASYPVYTLADLRNYAGSLESDYPNTAFVPTAIAQATLLFKLGTCLSDFPDNPIHSELAQNAILAMAQAIYTAQKFQAVLSNPFSSETIGSYSYSKVAGAVANGLPTGVSWFDIAISTLGVCDIDVPAGGGIELVDSNVEYRTGSRAGNSLAITVADVEQLRGWGYDPAPRY